MGNQKGVTNCQNCIDCQRMVDISDGSVSWRCYGRTRNGVEMKRDIRKYAAAPRIAPTWCPNRVPKSQ
ncbi:hypothetical protein LCGC14_1279840 [marine sediment metagenome]|uniref:Uncharacterized protein n=1 Tax=marine sediment metagenome TaxID=412755 RepID=A0A0F9NCA3_9ZZZZ